MGVCSLCRMRRDAELAVSLVLYLNRAPKIARFGRELRRMNFDESRNHDRRHDE